MLQNQVTYEQASNIFKRAFDVLMFISLIFSTVMLSFVVFGDQTVGFFLTGQNIIFLLYVNIFGHSHQSKYYFPWIWHFISLLFVFFANSGPSGLEGTLYTFCVLATMFWMVFFLYFYEIPAIVGDPNYFVLIAQRAVLNPPGTPQGRDQMGVRLQMGNPNGAFAFQVNFNNQMFGFDFGQNGLQPGVQQN
jgi:hypothetical protein